MGDKNHVRQFDRGAYESTLKSMVERNESVHAVGREILDRTGKLDPNVDIVGKPPRVSRNGMVPGEKEGTYVLPHGVSLPILSIFDGTASTSQWLEQFFKTAERQFKVLAGVRTRYHPQLATSVVNDVWNVAQHGIPVVQVSQFESDERSAEQVRLLLPASMGNNSPEEDYDLGLFYPLSISADLWEFYGLKGYLTLTLDEIGKGSVRAADIKKYLGQSVDAKMDTAEICEKLSSHWHVFVLQVPTYTGDFTSYSQGWWADRVGKSRVIQVEKPSLLADFRAALVYVTEAQRPSFEGLKRFLKAGDKAIQINASDLDTIWRNIQVAEEHFSAQFKLPGYDEIPLPGSTFAHFRHAWPIDHSRQDENITPGQ